MQGITVTTAEADAYFAGRLYAEPWLEASESDRAKALSWAARLLDAAYVWNGELDSGAREALVGAVSEEAVWLLTRNPAEMPELLTLGVRRASAGPVSFEADPSFLRPLIAPAADRLARVCGVQVLAGGTITSTML